MTAEAWRRKDGQADDYAARSGSSSTTHSRSGINIEEDNNDTNALFEEIVETAEDDSQEETPLNTQDRQSSISDADKFRVSLSARESNSRLSQPSNSLRNRLSWLAVMHDWKWQVMLG